MSITYQDLKKKDVLEISSGKNLGKINDLVIEKKSGRILKIVVPGRRGSFLSCENLEIKYSSIQKIGDDVILVDLSEKCECKKPPKPQNCCLPCENDCALQVDLDGFQDE
jgi:YlmC/YmxH family sporulation protein